MDYGAPGTAPISVHPMFGHRNIHAKTWHIGQTFIEGRTRIPETFEAQPMQPCPALIGQLVPSFQRTVGQL